MLLPKGATVRRLLETFITDYERKAGYLHVFTPDIAKKELYIQSGHWEHYKDGMFPPMELGEKEGEEDLVPAADVLPAPHPGVQEQGRGATATCRSASPNSATCTATSSRASSAGCRRVRCMTLNDAHLFVRPDQVKTEIAGVLSLMKKAYARPRHHRVPLPAVEARPGGQGEVRR